MTTYEQIKEALIAMLDEKCKQCYINDQICTQGLECHWNGKRGEICDDEAMDKAITALAAPARNCDVGTAKEQSARFDKFCYDHRSYEKGCGGCPFLTGEPCCELAWAQMPYESEGTK